MRDHKPDCTGPDVATWQGRQEAMVKCRTCGAIATAADGLPGGATTTTTPAPDTTRGRYWLTCARCDHTIRLHNPKPRVPLCDRCKATPRTARSAVKQSSDSTILGL